jgi:DNA-directed RNA polymerase beta' subunit
MSRDQIERQMDGEQRRLDARYERGELTREEYNEECRALEREARDALRGAEEEEHDRIRREYGGW